MDEYGLLREDWDSVCELQLGHSKASDPRNRIAAQVKSAFTRTYNKQAHAGRVAAKDSVDQFFYVLTMC